MNKEPFDTHLNPSRRNRRDFLKRTALCAGGLGAWPALARSAKGGVNDEIGVAIIGLGDKGGQHVDLFAAAPGVRVTALCEVDPKRLAAQAAKFASQKLKPFTTTDPRRVLDRADVDAVVIAAPNHWHALLTLWALRAGKDVYVEKPVSHNFQEGVRMVAEAKASGRIVQAGTQHRSCTGLRAAAAWLREGHLGKPLWCRIVWYKYRNSIGKCAPWTPTELDYDLWCGPAALDPLTRPQLHYDWHWFWATGDGDLGNLGVHTIDGVRLLVPELRFPRRILSVGGRFVYDDAGQTPNVQMTLVEFPTLPMLIENRCLSMDKDDVVMDQYRRMRDGFVLQYEKGCFSGFRAGGVVFDNEGKELKRFQGDNGATHHLNFIEAIRSRRREDLRALIEEGHVSSGVCHVGNISYRLGQRANLAECRAALGDHAMVTDTCERVAQNLKTWGVNLDLPFFRKGTWLEVDPATGEILRTGDGHAQQLAQARGWTHGTYRAPYLLPV
jgi:predicted dehydrogenase